MKNTVGKKKKKESSRKKVKKQWLCETPLLKVHMIPSDFVKMQILIHQVWAWDLQFCTSNKISGDNGAAGPALMAEQGTLGPNILRWHKEEFCYHGRECSHPSHLEAAGAEGHEEEQGHGQSPKACPRLRLHQNRGAPNMATALPWALPWVWSVRWKLRTESRQWEKLSGTPGHTLSMR